MDPSCNNGGGETPPGTGPVGGEKEKLGIFLVKNGTIDKTKNYADYAAVAAAASDAITYGQTYEIVTFEDTAGTDLPDSTGNSITTTNYSTFTWYLAKGDKNDAATFGTTHHTWNTAADVTTLGADFVLATGTSKQIQLGSATAPANGWNAVYAVTDAPKAGIQGFHLSAEAK